MKSRLSSVSLFLFAVALSGCSTLPPVGGFRPTPVQEQTVKLLVQRLQISREVAWIKFQNHLPVQDPQREAQLLNALTIKGQTLGLPAASTEYFFSAQIRASREVQEELIRGWKRGAMLPTTPPLDLKTQIRPQLDAVSDALLRSWQKMMPLPETKGLHAYVVRTIMEKGFSKTVAQMAAQPFKI